MFFFNEVVRISFFIKKLFAYMASNSTCLITSSRVNQLKKK